MKKFLLIVIIPFLLEGCAVKYWHQKYVVNKADSKCVIHGRHISEVLTCLSKEGLDVPEGWPYPGMKSGITAELCSTSMMLVKKCIYYSVSYDESGNVTGSRKKLLYDWF